MEEVTGGVENGKCRSSRVECKSEEHDFVDQMAIIYP